MKLDDLCPSYVREKQLWLTLAPGSVPQAFRAVVVDVSYDATAPAGTSLPLVFEVRGPTTYVRRDFLRARPVQLAFVPREGGPHAIILREAAHNRWWGSLKVEVAGDRTAEQATVYAAPVTCAVTSPTPGSTAYQGQTVELRGTWRGTQVSSGRWLINGVEVGVATIGTGTASLDYVLEAAHVGISEVELEITATNGVIARSSILLTVHDAIAWILTLEPVALYADEYSTGATVTRADLSVNGRDQSQSVAGDQPSFGATAGGLVYARYTYEGGVDLDGKGLEMAAVAAALSGKAEATALYVCRHFVNRSGTFFSFDNSDFMMARSTVSGNTFVYVTGSAYIYVPNETGNVAYTARYRGSDGANAVKLWIDGVLQSPTVVGSFPATLPAMTTGASGRRSTWSTDANPADNDSFLEVYFDRALSDDELAILHAARVAYVNGYA